VEEGDVVQTAPPDDSVHPRFELCRRARLRDLVDLFIEEPPPVRVASVETDAPTLQQSNALFDDAADRRGVERPVVFFHGFTLALSGRR
jgi:hypothetical protein